ncbi:MAG: hypothetical protein HFG72_03190 [Hungatella sp.]|jgi:hypothetical protein|nr:hypothetical protein [Hungatella sp.]
MTKQEQSDMWKAEIEKGLNKVKELRMQLKPVEFTSKLWETYQGAYGDVREDVAFLFCPKELIPDTEKLRRLDDEEKDSYEIIFDNLSENLTHQLSLYHASYLVMPYLALLLELKRQEGDFDWQMKVIVLAGDVLATDIPYCGGGSEREALMPEEVMDSYRRSVAVVQERTKEFLGQYMDRLKEMEPDWKRQYFCTDVLAILGDREAAFQMLMGQWEQCPLSCPDCGYYDEEMEADGFYDREQLEKIEPAPSVIGKWDGKSYEDTYVWFSNLVHLLGVEDEWKVAYYFGTYTCPVCGSKGVLIEWMKEME